MGNKRDGICEQKRTAASFRFPALAILLYVDQVALPTGQWFAASPALSKRESWLTPRRTAFAQMTQTFSCPKPPPCSQISSAFTPPVPFALSSLCHANQAPTSRLPLLRKNSTTSCTPRAQAIGQHAPHKTGQLSRQGRHPHIPLRALLNHPGIPAPQTLIRPIPVGNHPRRLTTLSRLQLLGLVPDSSPGYALRRLHQQAPKVGVPCLGDPQTCPLLAAGRLTRLQTQKGGKVTRTTKTRKIADLRQQGQSDMRLDPQKTT